jgi:SAM-dependent methyltransferase
MGFLFPLSAFERFRFSLAMSNPIRMEEAVRARYSEAAQQAVPALCCSVEYDRRFLQVIPPEILERDYGCGDPSRHLRAGETVLDLGSGAGKICFIASQVVGAKGKVIGVDMNDDMLALARQHQHAVGEAIGWHNVEFRKGRIQDLGLDLERLNTEITAHPVGNADAFLRAESFAQELRRRHPLVPDESVDVVISNCVLNLVDGAAKAKLFQEIHRVLRPGGRAVISDIVSDKEVPSALQNDPELWSGCISGALTEKGFVAGFVDVGFDSVRILELGQTPWRTVQGIEFRSMTLEAFKAGKGTEGHEYRSTIPGQRCC